MILQYKLLWLPRNLLELHFLELLHIQITSEISPSPGRHLCGDYVTSRGLDILFAGVNILCSCMELRILYPAYQ